MEITGAFTLALSKPVASRELQIVHSSALNLRDGMGAGFRSRSYGLSALAFVELEVSVVIILPLVALALSGFQQADVPVSRDLTLESFEQRQEARMMAGDSDGDGRISVAEYEAAAKPGHGDAAKRFAKFDLNHDGYLEKAEIDAMLARRFRHLDRDGNGILTPAERHPPKASGIVAPKVAE